MSRDTALSPTADRPANATSCADTMHTDHIDPNGHFNFPPLVQPQVLWLSITLQPALSQTQLSAWRTRLFAFLSGRQLTAAVSLQRLAVVPLRRSLGAFDRGMVIGWLLAQAEITQVGVSARPVRLAPVGPKARPRADHPAAGWAAGARP